MSFKTKADADENESNALFEVLDVELQDGTSFSALGDHEPVLYEHPTTSLGKTIALPACILICYFEKYS